MLEIIICRVKANEYPSTSLYGEGREVGTWEWEQNSVIREQLSRIPGGCRGGGEAPD